MRGGRVVRARQRPRTQREHPGPAEPVATGMRVRRDVTFAYSCHMPAKSHSTDIEDVEPLADITARPARRVVAAYATDADECRIFLSMLGIGPAKNES